MNIYTEWFPANIKPVREGVYETKWDLLGKNTNFQYWDGLYWGCYAGSPEDAYVIRKTRSLARPNPVWRGLNEQH